MRKQFAFAALIFLLLSLIPLWRPVLLGEAFVPAGMQKGIRPWQQPDPPAWDVLRWDSVAQFYPWRKYLVQSLSEGNVPLWNRHELVGTPFLANSQSAVFYPLHWLLAPFGAIPLIAWSALLHLVWAGLGVYVLCRRLGCGWMPAVFAGMTFELSQWMIAWQQLPSLPMTAAWIPWVLAAVHRVYERADFPAVVRLGLCAGLMTLAGHLQIATYGFLAAGLFAVYLTLVGRRLVPLLAVGGGVALALCLAAVQFLPTYELGKLSHRANTPTEEGYGFYVRLAMPTSMLGMVMDPYFAGDPNLGTYVGPEPLPEYAAYAGLLSLPLLLPFLIFWKAPKPEVQFFLILFIIAWLLALGTVLNKSLYFGIPGWSSTGSPARVLCLAALAISVIGAVALTSLTNRAKQLAKSSVWLTAVLAFQGTTLVTFPYRFGLTAPSADIYPSFEGQELLAKASPYRVAAINDKWAQREYPPMAVLPPNSALAYGYDEIGGYDSIILKKTKEQVLDKLNGGDSAPIENGNMMFIKPPALANGALPFLGCKYVITPDVLLDPGPLRLAARGDGIAIYEFPDLAKLVALRANDGRLWAGDIKWQGPNSLRFTMSADTPGGTLTALVIGAPGWKLDGRKATGELWLSGTVGEGQEFRAEYEPDSYRIGLFLTLFAVAISVACLVSQLRAEKPDPEVP